MTKNSIYGPNCFRCRHFAITWQIKRAYACRLMGFKSASLPSLVVRRSSGQACLGFEAKPAKKST
ncbi:MAG: uracil-DNA glycosylase [Desulfarculales bacterium]|jgi:hypothetical protein|nr:uracil-DNA glycosylase [Desulfarculales bacterium]